MTVNNRKNDSSTATQGGAFAWPKQPLNPDDFEDSYESWEDLFYEDKEATIELKCTCGGYKTYNSYAPGYHSDWCEVRKNLDETRN